MQQTKKSGYRKSGQERRCKYAAGNNNEWNNTAIKSGVK